VSIKYTYEYVKNYIESFDYTLLSDTYKSRTKLLVKCDKGHEYGVIFGNFKRGTRCPTCNGGIKLTYEYIKSFISDAGCTLLSDSYKNSLTPLHIKCNKGHEYYPTFGNFYRGQGCPVCAGKKRHTYEHIKSVIEADGSTILLSDEYVGANSKLLVKCTDKNHEYGVIFGNFRRGSRCPLCSNNVSKGEEELSLFVRSLGVSFIRNDRTQIINPLTGYNLELDIWIPSTSKAIEYNGLYYHSLLDRVKYDTIKQEQCIQKGIDLLIVTDHNWLNNNEFERQKIKMWLDNMY